MRYVERLRGEQSELFDDASIFHVFGGRGAETPDELTADVVVTMQQVHGTHVEEVAGDSVLERKVVLPDTDGVITARKEVALSIRTGDCIPMIAWDPHRQIIGASHQGWKGSRDNMAATLVHALVDRGCNPKKLRVALGPSLLSCHLEFSPDDVTQFEEQYPDWAEQVVRRSDNWDKPHLDLPRLNQLQLIDAGIQEEHIDISTTCTLCPEGREQYVSFRDGTHRGADPRKNNWSYIMMR